MTGAARPLLERLGRGPPLRLDPVAGGCIATAGIARFADGSEAFVKTAAAGPGMFEAEAAGLDELRAAGAIRVPRVLAVDSGGIVLERICEGARPPGFFEKFGRALASLHRHRAELCGFAGDNFIGATPQPNAPVVKPEAGMRDPGSDWVEFFVQRRLRFQCERAAAKRGDAGGLALLRDLDRGESRIRELLAGATEPPGLLHGDLWGGNYLVDEGGRPVLIDPAVYYGHREADLAMTRLFGGFAPEFYSAYEECWPLAAGHAERLPLYQLYHLVNHFNLFGGTYGGQARRILERYR